MASEWEKDCLHWRGRPLIGLYAHYCEDWDGLPIDETTPEWPCACRQDIDERIKNGTWRTNRPSYAGWLTALEKKP